MSTTIKNIQDNIVTTLQGINGSPTYTNTITESQVINRSAPTSGQPLLPCIEVIRGDQVFQKHPSSRQLTICNFTLEFTTLNETQAEVDAWLVDIVKALTTDITRGGYAFETFITQINHSPEAIQDYKVYRMIVECMAEIAFGTL